MATKKIPANTLKDREVANAKCGKLEEELQSVMFEKHLLKRCREDDKNLADKFVEEMEAMKSEKNVDMDMLKARDKANVSKISALNEDCRFPEENKGQLEKKVEELNEEVGKNLIQISSLQEEISKLQSARKSLEDAHSSCKQNIATVQREKNLKVKEAADLRMQLNDSLKTKQVLEQKLEVVQKKLDHQTTENEQIKKHLNSLTVEKASLEKQFETSNKKLKDIEKKLKRLTAEVMGKERAHENRINSETEVEVDNDEEMKLFFSNMEVIRLAVKDKDAKINDLNKKMELLQLSVASSNNKGRKWKWFFPATTIIFAVVSLAYAAGR